MTYSWWKIMTCQFLATVNLHQHLYLKWGWCLWWLLRQLGGSITCLPQREGKSTLLTCQQTQLPATEWVMLTSPSETMEDSMQWSPPRIESHIANYANINGLTRYQSRLRNRMQWWRTIGAASRGASSAMSISVQLVLMSGMGLIGVELMIVLTNSLFGPFSIISIKEWKQSLYYVLKGISSIVTSISTFKDPTFLKYTLWCGFFWWIRRYWQQSYDVFSDMI